MVQHMAVLFTLKFMGTCSVQYRIGLTTSPSGNLPPVQLAEEMVVVAVVETQYQVHVLEMELQHQIFSNQMILLLLQP